MNEECYRLLASVDRGKDVVGVCADASLLEAVVPGRVAANIFNIAPCEGGDKQMKAMAGRAVARLWKCVCGLYWK